MPIVTLVLTADLVPMAQISLISALTLTVLTVAIPAEALDIPLTVQNRTTRDLSAEPVTSGVPFAAGTLADTSALRLLLGWAEVPAQFEVTARWPDGSVRWVLVDFQADLDAEGERDFMLQTAHAPQAVDGIAVTESADGYRINTGATQIDIDRREFKLYGHYFEVEHNGTRYRAVPDGGWQIEQAGPLKTVLRAEGKWYAGSTRLRDSLIGFRGRFSFFRNKSTVRAALTFRNNNSQGWQPENPNTKPNLTIGGVYFGTERLSAGGHLFGNGIESTWEADLYAGGAVQKRESRYDADGALAPGFTAAPPLAIAPPAYYAVTEAWGTIVPPLSAAPEGMQSDFDLFEKIQRAKVIQADVENPSGLTGKTIWGHMYPDLNNWNHYGGLRWGGGFGPVSDNHYDWSYSMYLHLMRTGELAFLDAARVFARHELDFAIYHTNDDGPAFNHQKNWESRPSDDSPYNEFGGGRPSHTWSQGYALHRLITGDPRGRDGFQEILDGLRQYLYESFNGEGYIDTRELRIAGWLAEGLVNYWRISPDAMFSTASYGSKTIPQALKDVLQSVLDYEAADGGGGYVYVGDYGPDIDLRQPLMQCYFLEPAIKAYREVFKGRDPVYAAVLLGLIRRMTDFLMAVTYGGESNDAGLYLPRSIPYIVDVSLSQQTDGQLPYLLMSANAAGFLYS